RVGLSTKIESSDEEAILGEDASKQGMKIANIDADEEIKGEEVFVAEKEVVAEMEVAVNEKNVEVVSAADTLVSTATTAAVDEEIT
ncbi:hypothetical protein Tco_0518594, partial [Tanacetum coccineum]